MFPSFIGILDIQSWWEVPSIAHFCSLFRAAFNLLDFDIEELEEALLTDGTEESASSLLTELIVRLLCGCLGNKDISAFNYQMFLRRLFRQKCQETNRYNPFNTDIDFQFLPLRTKVEILYALCDFRLDADDVFDLFKNLEAESLRVEPLGWDNKSSAYWYFYGTRLYREDYKEKPKGKKQKKKEDKRKKKHGNLVEEEDDTERVWQVVCFTESDWTHLTEKLKNATSKVEKDLYHALSENFLPEIPRLFKDKERLQRKRLLESVPRRTSSRVQTKNKQKEDDIPKPMEDLPKTRENTPSEREERARHRNLSRAPSESSESRASSSSLRRAPGRQTNNSLACATGRILIPEGGPPGRKKLKTSQISYRRYGREDKASELEFSLLKQSQVRAPPAPYSIDNNFNPGSTDLIGFAHSEEDIQTDMYKVLEQLKAHEDAWPFMDPVEEDYAPNYYSVIRRPMDLQRMEERLDQGYYTDFNSFKADFNLIVNNCRLYNGHDNEYTGMVGNLEIAFDRLTQRYFEGPTSTDDEIAVEYPPQNPSPRKHKTEHLESKKKKRKLVTDESANSDDDIKSDGRRLSADRITPEKRRKTDKKQKKHESTLPDDVEYFSDHSVTIETDKDKISQHKHDKKHKKMKNQKSSRKSRKEKHALKKSKLKKKQQKYEEKIKRKKDRMSSLDSMMSENFDPKTKLPSKIREVTPEIDFFKDKFDKIKERRRGSSKNLNLETITEKVSTKAKINLSIPEKDKNLNLKETIEKLKAKSKKNDENSVLFDDMFQSNPKPLKKHKMECSELASKQDRHLKPKTTDEYEFVDDLDDLDGDQNKSSKVKNDKVKKITKKQAITKNESATEALEQAVKDISKWLDDTEFNSNSTSPLQVSTADDFMSIAPKIDEEADLQDKDKWANLKKDSNIKKRLTQKDAGKVVSKRKEIQRTIERLQPGKSKGNLITNIPTNSKPEEVTPSALAISKAKEVKNSLIVKTDEGSPKLSLGTVLPSEGFGLGKQHNFTNEINSTTASKVKVVDTGTMTSENEDSKEDKSAVKTLDPVETPKPEVGPTKISLSQCQEKATPNLSAWFKAFGAPKSGTSKKKVDDIDQDDSKSNDNETKNTSPPDSSKTEQVPVEEALTPDGGESPMATTVAGSRPRRTSTGSSISERSSFSQDLDSPRHQPSHPSPLLRSPASPRIEDHQKNYPLMNGSVRVGFYQDTTSVKSSPEKSCSPREAPQSPYAAYSQHVYAAASAAANSANISSQYSADGPNKSPLPTYGQTQPPAYYDTSKVNQSSKPAHGQDDYTAYGPDMGYQQPTSPFAGPFSPAQSPYSHHSQHSPYSHPQHSPQTFNVVQNPTGNNPLHIAERQQDKTAVFPVKKRTYNEPKLAVSEASMASPVAAPTNPIYSLGQTYKDSLDKPGSSQNPSMPFYEPDKSAPITSSNVMQSNPPSVIMSTDPNSAHKFGMYSGPKTTNVEEVSVISMATTSSLMTESNTQNMATRNQYQSIITPDYGARKSQYDFHLGLNKNYEEESENSTLSQDVNKHPYASIKNSGIVPRPDIISRSSPMDMVNMGYGKSMDNLKGKSNVDMVNMGYLLPDPNKMDKLGRLNPGKIDPNHAKSVSRGFDLYNSMPTNLAYMGRLDSNVNQGMAKMSSTPDPNDVRYNSMLHYQHPQFDNNKSLSSELPESLITRNESTIKQTVGPMVKDNTKKTPTATNYTDWKMDASKANISSHKTSIMETKSPSVEANQTVKSSNESQLTYEQIPTSKQTEEAEQMPPDYRSTNRRAVIERSSSKYKPDSQPTSQADFNSHLRNVNLNMGMHSDRTYSHNVSMNPVSTACKPPPPYSHSPHPMDQSMRALTGLPHIMERFTKDDKTINFPSSSPSFHDKSLSLYAKSLHGTATSSPMYPTTSMPMTYSKEAMYSNVQPAHSTQQELQDNRQTEHEAKPKSRKKKSNTETAASSAASQFHSYPSLKTTQTSAAEQSAISLKSANIVPGSAFNFGPSAGVGLYSDSSSFLELRNSPVNQFTANMAANFMVAAAAAHQRSTPDPNDKTKPAHQPPASPYQFLNHPQVRPGYPFMDPAAPLYQQYIQQQELLRHSGSQMMGIFSPSFPGPLGTRQTFDSRPPWM